MTGNGVFGVEMRCRSAPSGCQGFSPISARTRPRRRGRHGRGVRAGLPVREAAGFVRVHHVEGGHRLIARVVACDPDRLAGPQEPEEDVRPRQGPSPHGREPQDATVPRLPHGEFPRPPGRGRLGPFRDGGLDGLGQLVSTKHATALVRQLVERLEDRAPPTPSLGGSRLLPDAGNGGRGGTGPSSARPRPGSVRSSSLSHGPVADGEIDLGWRRLRRDATAPAGVPGVGPWSRGIRQPPRPRRPGRFPGTTSS